MSIWPATARYARLLHRHFGEQMKYSGIIGLTHRKSSPDEPAQALPGAKPKFFFAPDQIRKRAKEWGPGGVDMRFGAAWSAFVPKLDQWVKVSEGHGPAAVQRAYLDTLNGRVPPDQGLILSLYRNRRHLPHALSAPSRMGIGCADRENAAKTAGDGKRPCSTGRTTVRSPPTIGWRSSRKRSAKPDDALLKTLFHPDSYWRDVLALSWNIQTLNGRRRHPEGAAAAGPQRVASRLRDRPRSRRAAQGDARRHQRDRGDLQVRDQRRARQRHRSPDPGCGRRQSPQGLDAADRARRTEGLRGATRRRRGRAATPIRAIFAGPTGSTCARRPPTMPTAIRPCS